MNNLRQKLINSLRQTKSSLTMEKQKTAFSIYQVEKHNLPLLLPKLLIKTHRFARVEFTKFLDVSLDEHLFQKNLIKYIENKVAKNIGLLYRAKPRLNENSLLTLYFLYIYTYVINYANLVWGSTTRRTNQSTKACSIQIINNKTRFDCTNELSKSQKILNTQKLKIVSATVSMFNIKNKTANKT